jgi:hypothetical protein
MLDENRMTRRHDMLCIEHAFGTVDGIYGVRNE